MNFLMPSVNNFICSSSTALVNWVLVAQLELIVFTKPSLQCQLTEQKAKPENSEHKISTSTVNLPYL